MCSLVIEGRKEKEEEEERGVLASSIQHHRGDGPASSLGLVSMGTEQRAVRSGGLIVEAAVLLRSRGVG